MIHIHPSRRRFLLGAGALFATPAIVRASSIMPVSVVARHRDDRIAFDWSSVDVRVVTIQYPCLYGTTEHIFEFERNA